MEAAGKAVGPAFAEDAEERSCDGIFTFILQYHKIKPII